MAQKSVFDFCSLKSSANCILFILIFKSACTHHCPVSYYGQEVMVLSCCDACLMARAGRYMLPASVLGWKFVGWFVHCRNFDISLISFNKPTLSTKTFFLSPNHTVSFYKHTQYEISCVFGEKALAFYGID